MSPSPKSRPRKPKPSHSRRKHSPDGPPPDAPPLNPPPPPPILDEDPPAGPARAEARALLGTLLQLTARAALAPDKAGKLIAFADTLDLPPMPEQSAAADPWTAIALAPLARIPDAAPARHAMTAADDWALLGADLAARGPHRLPLAARAARAAAGGAGMAVEEEDAIAAWVQEQCVDVAIKRGGIRAAVEIWYVLIGDWQRDPFERRPARCPEVDACPCPPARRWWTAGSGRWADERRARIAGFFAGIRAAAAGYVHTAIAGASHAEIDELRAVMRAEENASDDPTELEMYRPWGQIFVEDRPAVEMLDRARLLLTQRRLSNEHACLAMDDWAHGFAKMASEHTIPPVARIGAIAWFARVALCDESSDESSADRADDDDGGGE